MATRPEVLALTGERTAPGIWHENYWFRRHQAAYAAVPGWVTTAPRTVLDAGCGEGYAAGVLAEAWPGVRVVGVDYDAASVGHARRTHGGAHATYVRAALTALPLASASVDLVVSLQVLEHIWTPLEYVRELDRVAAPGAVVVLSTPNRLTFSPGLGRLEAPPNAYHVREYDAAELAREVGRWLPARRPATLLGLHHGPRLQAWEDAHGSVVAAQQARPPQEWDDTLATLVTSVGSDDFVLGEADGRCLDLVVVSRAGAARTARGRRTRRPGQGAADRP